MAAAAEELGEFLRARRGMLRPEQVGYPADPGRRVAGLRREEVAELAGISLEYYVRLEQGNGRYRVSETVLRGLARALRLDEGAASYFSRLAAPPPALVQEPSTATAAPGELIRSLVERWSDLPVFVHDRNLDVLLANDFAIAMFPLLSLSDNNLLNATFLAPEQGRAMAGWQAAARELVAALRYHGDPADPRMRQLVAELDADPDFRRLWAAHDAQPLNSGTSPVMVEGVGFGEVPWQSLVIPGGFFMVVHLPGRSEFAARALERISRDRPGAPGVIEFDGSHAIETVDASEVLADFERIRRGSTGTGSATR